jgi:hypothetical protein
MGQERDTGQMCAGEGFEWLTSLFEGVMTVWRREIITVNKDNFLGVYALNSQISIARVISEHCDLQRISPRSHLLV